MFGDLDIACFMDSKINVGGTYFVRDRSTNGIHLELESGVAEPTWDAIRGLYTFDGADGMLVQSSADVNSVLANMGSRQDETYIFLANPFVYTAVDNDQWFNKGSSAAGTDYVYLRQRNAGGGARFQFRKSGTAGTYNFYGSNNSLLEIDRQVVLLTLVIQDGYQAYYFNEQKRDEGTNADIDVSNNRSLYVGRNDPADGGNQLPAGTGISMFGYGRFAATDSWVRSVCRHFRNML